MADLPDADREAAQAALAPTLEATAAILPWLAKPRPPRFPAAAGEAWAAASRRLAAAWDGRHGEGYKDLRPAVFALCGVALDLRDADCLALTEALASATDRLETPGSLEDARLVAGLCAAIEALADPAGIEHEAFGERARHFAGRLQRCAAAEATPSARTPALERLFAEEARECLEHMAAALQALPPDAYGLKSAAAQLARLAEPLELDAIAARAGEVVRLVTLRAGESVDLDAVATRTAVAALLADLERQVGDLG